MTQRTFRRRLAELRGPFSIHQADLNFRCATSLLSECGKVLLECDRFVKDTNGWKVHLRTAKTKTEVFIPVENYVVEDIEALPGEYPFWSGESSPESYSSVWQEAYRKLFKQAEIKGHPRRFRHTFAKNLLLSEVPLETVSLLPGHKKLAITEKHYARFVPDRQALIEAQVRKSWARTGHSKK